MRCGVFYWPARGQALLPHRHTGIVLNARIVGDADLVVNTVKRLWSRGLKLIVVTYCPSPDEQARVYDRVHEVCA